MRIFRRRSGGTDAATDAATDVGTSKEAALAEARRATANLRRANARAERYRAGKQADPANEITTAGPTELPARMDLWRSPMDVRLCWCPTWSARVES